MDECSLTEQECIDFLLDVARLNDEKSPRCIVMNRLQRERSTTRKVKFALVVTSNNIKLIDALIYACLDFDDNLYFIGSEVNLQTDLEVEYLYFEASINPTKNTES